MQNLLESINVAPSSTSGHFVQGAQKVVNLDKINETYFVDGPSKLITKNHTTLEQPISCLITTQFVYNPFKKKHNKIFT